ncbi:D-alanyl-D-alanine carboxypeptidase/D-alanyl-D-alanine-endopeptidase (penicillin-binding protein 4) [Ureibacillus xyleni]|uniref:D-alanyl-D-alanine carboxypeptidase/D-alanyl-D-alanine-endopeptidase (Penicillin-binding protein 4) n=1 Tax=Ureibacillus xyleni TaxID=614648 RepID=A0A285TGR6_9BACL|nr:D-alanyl-D-alanine carboxypeptidase/D-alanyl-D-alanine-endopeptidase [Ureibacillus xyleni]SOC20948.1 D-alanyl-D-alanine carboxypeptidase/D-alanyl-D-alanine-endopeptidase (penicillin-binding protein 4) [Ureibacillus xyleni]
MKKKLTIYILIFALFLSNVLFVNNAKAASSLDATVQNSLGNSNISVSLRSLQTGKVLYERNGEIGRKPASTMKLLTASAALHTLGPDFRFKTELYIDGEVKNNVLNGDVYIKGGGDPTLNKKDFSSFAVALKRQGIRTINGNVYGDDTLFSGSQLTPGVVPEDETYYYGARTSALTMSPNSDYDSGTIIVNVKPSSVGRAPNVTAEPNLSGMQILNKAKTVRKGQRNTVKVIRKYRTNQIVITGNLPVASSTKEWITLQDPTINTLHATKITLESTGLKFSKTSKVTRKAVPESATLLYTKSSIPLKTLMNPFLKLSNNSIADILVKTMGNEVYGKGHISFGLKVLNDYGSSIGLNMNNWKFEDGSGMSHQNRISTNELSLLLLNVRNEQNYNLLYNALPVGGQKDRLVGGTLRKRFTQAPYLNQVHAKTGSLTGVYTLAGYITAKSGRTFAFAVMTQNQSSNQIDEIDAVVRKIYQLY